MRGSLEQEGCDSGLGPKIGQKFIFVDSLWYVVHDTRLVESFRLRPHVTKTVNHSGQVTRFRDPRLTPRGT